MSYLLTFIFCDVFLGIAMYGYICFAWRTYKKMIANGGWNLEVSNPSRITDAWRWFVPVQGVMMFFIVNEILDEMAYTSKRNCNNRLEIHAFGIDTVYREPDECN